MTSGWIKLFRLGLVSALAGITWLAFAPLGPATMEYQDKLNHVLAFLTLAFLTDFAFPRIRFVAVKYVPLLAYGLGLELVQAAFPHRIGSGADLLADAAGLFLYCLLIPLLRRLYPFNRRWKNPPRRHLSDAALGGGT